MILAFGLALGFRPRGGAAGVIAGIAVLVAFAFVLSWVFTTLGMLMRDEKSVLKASFMLFHQGQRRVSNTPHRQSRANHNARLDVCHGRRPASMIVRKRWA